MGQIGKSSVQGMLSTYYVELEYTFDNGISTKVMVTIDQYKDNQIHIDDISVIGVTEDSWEEGVEDTFPDDWVDEIRKEVLKLVSIEWSFAIRIDQTRKSMDRLGMGKDDKTEDSVNKQNSQSQYGKDEIPKTEYYQGLINSHKNYEAISDPINFIKNFKTTEQFYDWCNEGSIHDLEETLFHFEKAEVYEYCAIIKSCIQDKKKSL